MARMYRHAPLNAIWEGSGNVIALDVLRAAEHIPTFMKEVLSCRGMNSAVDDYVRSLGVYIEGLFKIQRESGSKSAGVELQLRARQIVDHMAVAMQASLLLRYGCPITADLFIQTRIRGQSASHGIGATGVNYGSIPLDVVSAKRIIDSNMPIVN